MRAGKSGRQLGEEHAGRLRAYLDRVESLPSRGGKLNVSAVALACQFDRAVLYNNPACKQMLADAVAAKGLSGILSGDVAAPGNDTIVRLERRVHQLEQLNEALKAEVYELRRELARRPIIEEHVIETGRRIKL
jgi:hypothetical protein